MECTSELRRAVSSIARLLRCSISAVRYRCNSAWIRRVNGMCDRAWVREMHFLLNRIGLRRIARVFRFFRSSNRVMKVFGENIIRRGMQDPQVVSRLMRVYGKLSGKLSCKKDFFPIHFPLHRILEYQCFEINKHIFFYFCCRRCGMPPFTTTTGNRSGSSKTFWMLEHIPSPDESPKLYSPSDYAALEPVSGYQEEIVREGLVHTTH